MRLLVSLVRRRDILRRILVERLTAPVHLNLLSLFVAVFGSTRAKIAFDLLVRQEYAYGLLSAADAARHRGLSRVTVVELGVGGGTGFLNLCALGRRITRATGVAFRLVGFDTGVGLPHPVDYRDHPELYGHGWYPMDRDRLRAALPREAELVLGDLKETIGGFLRSLSPDAPVAFAVLDVDYYSSAKAALPIFMGDASCYLPVMSIYVDDLMLDTHNPYCGEELAIREFNEEHHLRKITPDRFLPQRRVFKHAAWLPHMYKLHVLDHPERNDLEPPRSIRVAANPYLGIPGGDQPRAERPGSW